MKNSAHILIVEDLLSMRVVLKKALKELGFLHIDEAADGLAAWEMIRNQALGGSPYDLILSDVEMPEMNGLELLIKVLQDEWCRKSPFVFVSVAADEEAKEKLIKLGAKAYLERPFTPEDLKKCLDSLPS